MSTKRTSMHEEVPALEFSSVQNEDEFEVDTSMALGTKRKSSVWPKSNLGSSLKMPSGSLKAASIVNIMANTANLQEENDKLQAEFDAKLDEKDEIISRLKKRVKKWETNSWKIAGLCTNSFLAHIACNLDALKARLFEQAGIFMAQKEKEALLSGTQEMPELFGLDLDEAWAAQNKDKVKLLTEKPRGEVDLMFKSFLEEFRLRNEACKDVYHDSEGHEIANYRNLYREKATLADGLLKGLETVSVKVKKSKAQISVLQGNNVEKEDILERRRNQYLQELLHLKEELYQAQQKLSAYMKSNQIKNPMQFVDFAGLPNLFGDDGKDVDELAEALKAAEEEAARLTKSLDAQKFQTANAELEIQRLKDELEWYQKSHEPPSAASTPRKDEEQPKEEANEAPQEDAVSVADTLASSTSMKTDMDAEDDGIPMASSQPPESERELPTDRTTARTSKSSRSGSTRRKSSIDVEWDGGQISSGLDLDGQKYDEHGNITGDSSRRASTRSVDTDHISIATDPSFHKSSVSSKQSTSSIRSTASSVKEKGSPKKLKAKVVHVPTNISDEPLPATVTPPPTKKSQKGVLKAISRSVAAHAVGKKRASQKAAPEPKAQEKEEEKKPAVIEEPEEEEPDPPEWMELCDPHLFAEAVETFKGAIGIKDGHHLFFTYMSKYLVSKQQEMKAKGAEKEQLLADLQSKLDTAEKEITELNLSSEAYAKLTASHAAYRGEMEELVQMLEDKIESKAAALGEWTKSFKVTPLILKMQLEELEEQNAILAAKADRPVVTYHVAEIQTDLSSQEIATGFADLLMAKKRSTVDRELALKARVNQERLKFAAEDMRLYYEAAEKIGLEAVKDKERFQAEAEHLNAKLAEETKKTGLLTTQRRQLAEDREELQDYVEALKLYIHQNTDPKTRLPLPRAPHSKLQKTRPLGPLTPDHSNNTSNPSMVESSIGHVHTTESPIPENASQEQADEEDEDTSSVSSSDTGATEETDEGKDSEETEPTDAIKQLLQVDDLESVEMPDDASDLPTPPLKSHYRSYTPKTVHDIAVQATIECPIIGRAWEEWKKRNKTRMMDPEKREMLELILLTNFPDLEFGLEYFEVFEQFAGLQMELASLLGLQRAVAEEQHMMETTTYKGVDKHDHEKLIVSDRKVLIEKFQLFRSVETFTSMLLLKLRKSKDNILRNREDKLEQVLSAIGHLSNTHPNEAKLLLKQAGCTVDDSHTETESMLDSSSIKGISKFSASQTTRPYFDGDVSGVGFGTPSHDGTASEVSTLDYKNQRPSTCPLIRNHNKGMDVLPEPKGGPHYQKIYRTNDQFGIKGVPSAKAKRYLLNKSPSASASNKLPHVL